MGNKEAVCESIEPPGSNLTTRFHTAHYMPESTPELSAHSGSKTSLHDVIKPFHKKTLRPLRGNSDTAKPANERDVFRARYFQNVSDVEWNDWQWQVKNRIRSFDRLSDFIELSAEERAAQQADIHFPLSITPYYLSLFYDKDSCHPLRKAMVPQVFECLTSPAEMHDPLAEESQSPVPGLVHRYPDRVLFLVTTTCSCYCRYCTRSRVVGAGEKCGHPVMNRWNPALEYIREHREIRDVLISGGDPFMLSDSQLQWIISNIRKIPHVEIIRIGTKTPMVLPQRITTHLTRMLKQYHPLFISIHATHPDEATPESTEACGRLADAGIPLGSQTVLLAGINDSVETMRRLLHKLLLMRVRPYYLYQCDPILGSGHFRTPVRKGIEIIHALRGNTSGYALPTFVIDAPGGGGKIPVMPDYVISHDDGRIVLRNYNDKTFVYPDEKGRAACSNQDISSGGYI